MSEKFAQHIFSHDSHSIVTNIYNPPYFFLIFMISEHLNCTLTLQDIFGPQFASVYANVLLNVIPKKKKNLRV